MHSAEMITGMQIEPHMRHAPFSGPQIRIEDERARVVTEWRRSVPYRLVQVSDSPMISAATHSLLVCAQPRPRPRQRPRHGCSCINGKDRNSESLTSFPLSTLAMIDAHCFSWHTFLRPHAYRTIP